MNRKLIKGFEPLEEIIESANEDGFIEIVEDEDIIELVMEDKTNGATKLRSIGSTSGVQKTIRT
ncbi:hypothetical protein ACFW1P_33590 [Paenibacillus sp. NPDC058910]|uniref:hypothetical protein n=1 Tax=unclassified Paenibacillus TaxID=185978 RepID=UPI0036827C83